VHCFVILISRAAQALCRRSFTATNSKISRNKAVITTDINQLRGRKIRYNSVVLLNEYFADPSVAIRIVSGSALNRLCQLSDSLEATLPLRVRCEAKLQWGCQRLPLRLATSFARRSTDGVPTVRRRLAAKKTQFQKWNPGSPSAGTGAGPGSIRRARGDKQAPDPAGLQVLDHLLKRPPR
jgi:hypothetical protein